MKISNTCSSAITVLTLIAATPAGSLVSNASICKTANLPVRFVLQVRRQLVNAGILASVRRGYKFAPASQVTLLEIVEAIEGPIGDMAMPCLASSDGFIESSNTIAAPNCFANRVGDKCSHHA